MSELLRPDEIDGDLRELLLCIPGYDAIGTAGECRFDEAEARRAIDFIQRCLRHVEGAMAGKLFVLERWEKAIVANLFGWKRLHQKHGWVRRYRESMVMIGRKNGKSPLASAIALYLLFCDPMVGKQCYLAASDREQASIVYRHCKGMIQQEPLLEKRCKIYGGTANAYQSRTIVREEERSFLRVVSADADSKHGTNTYLAIIDELHAQPNRDLVDVFSTSMASENIPQPLLLFITTSDFDRESICNEKHDYASKVRDGIIEDAAFLPVIYEASKDDDWTDPAVWRKANPNIGVSVSEEYLSRECKRAQESPAYLNTFLRLHLNIRTQNDVAWLDMEKWDACNGPVDADDLIGRECFAGLDLSSTTDISALSLVFPDDEGYLVLPFFWVPGDNAEKRQRKDRVPYQAWERQGHLTLTTGNVIDYDAIRATINELSERFRIQKIAIDRWNATQLAVQLQGDGFAVEFFGQGYASMTAPTKGLEKLVVGGKLAHGGHPVLRWMASNVTVEQDAAGNLKPSKAKSSEKIDGIVATIMALGVAMTSETSALSVYDREERGFVEIG